MGDDAGRPTAAGPRNDSGRPPNGETLVLINGALLILAAAGFTWACVEYARSTWRTNDDLMGASMVFTFFWLIGSALTSVALVRLAVTTLPWAAGAFVAIVVLGKFFEWFAIEPVLHRMFPAYRRHE